MSFPLLKDRIFHTKNNVPEPIPNPPPSRPKRYKAWSEDHLRLAFKAIQEEGLSVRQAAEAFDVSKSTLHNRITGRVPFGKLSGHSRYLWSDVSLVFGLWSYVSLAFRLRSYASSVDPLSSYKSKE